jgi:hypothetical protein
MRIIITFVLISFLGNTHAQPPENDLEQRITQLEQAVIALKQQLEILSRKLENMGSIDSSEKTQTKIESALSNIPQLVLKRWNYHAVRIKINTYYAIDLELSNDYAKAIEEIDARVDFKNLLGGHLYSVNITPMLKIPAGQTVVDQGTESNRRLLGKEHQMTRLSPNEVKTELIIRKIVFEDGTLLNF